MVVLTQLAEKLCLFGRIYLADLLDAGISCGLCSTLMTGPFSFPYPSLELMERAGTAQPEQPEAARAHAHQSSSQGRERL